MISLPIQEHFRRFIKPHINEFLTEINYPLEVDITRFTVWADVESFNWKEDSYVWGQKRGRMQNIYSVYFDSIFICNLGDNRSQADTLKDFWNGFLKAYSLSDDDSQKIWLDKSIYQEKADEQKRKKQKQDQDIIDAIKAKPVKSETQALAKEIALNAAKSTRPTAK